MCVHQCAYVHPLSDGQSVPIPESPGREEERRMSEREEERLKLCKESPVIPPGTFLFLPQICILSQSLRWGLPIERKEGSLPSLGLPLDQPASRLNSSGPLGSPAHLVLAGSGEICESMFPSVLDATAPSSGGFPQRVPCQSRPLGWFLKQNSEEGSTVRQFMKQLDALKDARWTLAFKPSGKVCRNQEPILE